MPKIVTEWPKAMAYLEQFGIDPGTVARAGLNPEGYYSPTKDQRFVQDDNGDWTVTKGWTLWPAGFDYEEFQKALWQDEYAAAVVRNAETGTAHDH